MRPKAATVTLMMPSNVPYLEKPNSAPVWDVGLHAIAQTSRRWRPRVCRSFELD